MANQKQSGNNYFTIALIVIIVAVLAFAAAYYIFSYMPKQQKAMEVREYKKILYTSMLCQYNCPLENQTLKNKTVLLPSKLCIDECTSEFIAKNYTADSITQKDVSDDKLLPDISAIMNDCKSSATVNFTKVNTVQAFSCVRDKLEGLKSNYTYLN